MNIQTLSSTVGKFLNAGLPRSLERQLMLLTSICLATSILAYGYYMAHQQTVDARLTIKAEISALAQNLATVNAHYLQTGEPENIAILTLQTATVPGIYSVMVTDLSGKPIMEVVNKNGVWSPRYALTNILVPDSQGPDSVFEETPFNARQIDFLAGNSGTMSSWRRIVGSQAALGWVRVNFRLDTLDLIAAGIRMQAFKAIALATMITLLLLWMLLRPSMRALHEATEFAAKIDNGLGNKLNVSHLSIEIEALGNTINRVSERLAIQNVDVRNQKFAIDQHAIVSVTDLQGTIIYANQRFCDISGYSQNELLGQNHRLVKSDEHPPAVFEELWRTITQGNVWHGDIKNRKKDGGYYWVSATIVPLKGVDGLPHQYVGIRTEITAIKNLEHYLQVAKDQAEAATQAKGQFLANMSHEIRTPMNAILGMLKLVQNTDLTKRQLDYVSKAEGAAQSLLGLINDILDFSKIEAGKMALEVRTFRLDKLLRNLSVIVSSNVGNKPVEVLFDIDPKAPKSLMGDSLRLLQVLINLCGNAVKFTAQGDVIISIKVLTQVNQSVTLRFAVKDSGIGISPENQDHIFNGFSQAEASTTRRFGGTGLGLSISRRLVSLMGGELTLQSSLGRGSTFSFIVTLPVGANTLVVGQPASSRPLAPGLPVLVVDDNPTARELLAVMAESLGWKVDVAIDGEQALALIQARQADPYQAIFMDWKMPGMDGWEALTHIQNMALPMQGPVVVMVTAHGREMLTQRSAEDQARLHAFLVKPVTASMMFDAVADAMASRVQPLDNTHSLSSKEQPLQGMRLLVVEDNLVNQQVAQEVLEAEGAKVILADNGQLGIEAVLQANLAGMPFDAVLMDIQMPVMDGYAATHVLRQEMGLTTLPIIAMTANAMASDRDACLAVGMNAHVGKPFNLEQLVELLKNPPSAILTVNDEPPTSPEVTSTDPAVGPALPPVNTVDVAGALDRFGGNQALYGRVLKSYLDDIAILPDQFDVCLGNADLRTTTQMLHALKGLSATVGASYLTAVTRKAELSVKAAQSDPDTPFDAKALAVKLRTAIAETQTVLHRVAQSYKPQQVAAQAQSADAAQSPDLISLFELSDLLKTSDVRALAVYEKLQPSLVNVPFELRTQLDTAMSSFDFAQAAKVCQSLFDQSGA